MKCKLFLGVLGAATMLATAASAAIELDQSSIPDYPGYPLSVQGSGLSEGDVHGQTFTVGLDGQLAKLELAVALRDADSSGSLGVSLQRMNGEELFATQLFGGQPPTSVHEWWYNSPIDLTGANIMVKAGDQYKIVLTGGQGAESGDYGWFYMLNGVPFANSGGTAFIDTPYHHEFSFDYGFRTYVDTSAVPEPASWALMIAGFSGAGLALRRSRRLAARTA